MIVDVDNLSLNVTSDISNWNEAGNPMVYRMQRRDYTFDAIQNNAGKVQLVFYGVNIASSFNAYLDTLYIKDDTSVYDGRGLVIASTFSGGNTLVTLDMPYVSAVTIGYANNETTRANYRVTVSVYNSSNVQIGAASIFSPTSKGELLIDISAVVKSALSPDVDADLTSSTSIFDDSGVYVKFYIKYTEVWTGSAEAETDDVANQYFGVFGARQIPAPYGGNLYDYVSWNDGSPLGKFITKLTRPKVWRGYPWVVSALVGDAITDAVYFRVEYFDVNGTTISNASTTPTTANNGKIVLFAPAKLLAIPDTAKTAKIRFHNNVSGNVLVTEMTYDIVDPCANPVFLLARNSLGGVIQWMFDKVQEYTFEYNDGRKSKRLKMTTTNLNVNEWESVQDFINLGETYRENITELTSSTIKTHTTIGQQVYVIDSTGVKLGVVVIPTKNTTTTRRIGHNFELSIEYPETQSV
jgi:hypothetical protein